MNLTYKFLIKLLEKHGFFFKRAKGSHYIYYNSLTNISVVVPIHNKELKRGTFMAIAKQAGIDKAEL